MNDPRAWAIVALVSWAPVAIVLISAIVRGYTITIHFNREGRRDRGR